MYVCELERLPKIINTVYKMDIMEMQDLGSQFVENGIDIHEEMPVPKEEVVDIKADDSDLDIIEVHCNINPNRANMIRRHLPGKFRRKIQAKNGNPQQKLDIKEEIVISDSSDTDCDPLLNKQPKSGCSTRKNKESSLSTITLNCPKCNNTKTVYSTTLTSRCRECKVNMTFVCTECNQRYETLMALFRHKQMQCKKILPAAFQLMHKCPKCHVKYRISNVSKRRHCIKCKIATIYECKICSKELISFSVIYRHVKEQCQPRNKEFFCNDCSFKTTSERALLLHFSGSHQNLYKLNEVCKKCGKGFANYLTLKQHKDACGVRYYFCKFCPYRPRLQSSLQRHLMVTHKIAKEDLAKIVAESKCPLSYAQGKDTENAAESEKVVEVNEYVLKQLTEMTCPECNHTQPIVGRTKTQACTKCKKDLAYQCLYCPMRFRTLPLLQRHGRRMHAKVEYACNICKKPYSFFGDLREHQKWCGKEPRFKCQLCNFKTRYRHNLKGHMENLHDTNRPTYVCQDCGMGYKTTKAMDRHLEQCCAGVPRQ